MQYIPYIKEEITKISNKNVLKLKQLKILKC